MARGHKMPIPLARQIDERTMPVPFCGCLIWLGGTTVFGYGKMTFMYKTLSAHRVAWEMQHGEIPDGMFVCHKCDVPSCVNTDHLFLGTPQENSTDMVAKGRCRLGSAVKQSKLTVHDVRHIRRTDIRTKRLSDIYGVSKTTIKKVKSGKGWKHVQEV